MNKVQCKYSKNSNCGEIAINKTPQELVKRGTIIAMIDRLNSVQRYNFYSNSQTTVAQICATNTSAPYRISIASLQRIFHLPLVRV